ncbi:MAG: integrase arm-type DNA-binding domain-containing protein [Rhizobacter sp.]
MSRLTEPGLHFVGGVPGLALQVLPSGARTWVLRVVVGDKRREMGLGGYSSSGMTLAKAREAALEARAKIASGIDPIDQRRAAKSAIQAARACVRTFKQCGEAYIAAHASGWKNLKHGQQWQNTLEQYVYPVMGSLLVRDIEKEHVLAVLRPIWQTKNETASRLRGRIELVLSYAMQAGYRPEGLNPARWRGGLDKLLPKPSKVAKVEHHAALPADAMGEFMHRLRAAEGSGARALEFAILTAARSGEVRGATWAEIDIQNAMWIVPGERMKAGKEHRVPLSAAVLKLLKDHPREAGTSLVFPAPRGGQLSDMTLTAVLRRMKVPAVPHGFRSTFRDWVAERTSYPSDMAEMALAHAVGSKVEAAYRRGDMFEKRRQMMDSWAKFCATVTPHGAVIPMKRKTK